MKHSPHCNTLGSYCSPLLSQISASLVWDIQMTMHVMQNVLSSSGELRLWRYLKNAGSVGWVLVSWRYMTQQQLSVQQHLSITLDWLCWLQVHVFTWWTTTTIDLRIHVYNNVIYDTRNNTVSFQIFFLDILSMFPVPLLVILCYKSHQFICNLQ